MTWKVDIVSPPSEEGVCMLRATYADEGGREIATFSTGVDTNSDKDIQQFLNRCNEERARAMKLAGDSVAIAAKIEAVLNAGK